MPGWTGARKVPADWRKRRAAALSRARHTCQAEGCTARATEVDHIVPMAEGGGHEMSNLQALCSSCHRQKTNQEIARGNQRKPRARRTPEQHPGVI